MKVDYEIERMKEDWERRCEELVTEIVTELSTERLERLARDLREAKVKVDMLQWVLAD